MFFSASEATNFFFLFVRLEFGSAATTGVLYQPRMMGDGDCGEIGGMKIVQGKPKYSEKTCYTTNPT
jgi:hypothetical protein